MGFGGYWANVGWKVSEMETQEQGSVSIERHDERMGGVDTP